VIDGLFQYKVPTRIHACNYISSRNSFFN